MVSGENAIQMDLKKIIDMSYGDGGLFIRSKTVYFKEEGNGCTIKRDNFDFHLKS